MRHIKITDLVKVKDPFEMTPAEVKDLVGHLIFIKN